MNATPRMFDHGYPFDPTAGLTLDAMLRIPPPIAPDDFEAFWRHTRRAAAAVDPRPRFGPDEGDARAAVHTFTCRALGDAEVHGWLTLPRDTAPRYGLVVGHGYAGRTEPDLSYAHDGVAAIFPCARGRGRSPMPAPTHDADGEPIEHVLHGLHDRDTYIHRGCVADHWAAAGVLLLAVPALADRLGFCGSSFSGGLGAFVVAFDPRFRRAALSVPSYGHHPVRLTLPCVGSGESVRRYAQQHPGTDRILAYYDAASAASFIAVPTLVAVARFDPAVPPPGQAAVYAAIPARRSLFIRAAGHFPFPGEADEQRAWRQACDAWFEPLSTPQQPPTNPTPVQGTTESCG